MVLGLGQEARAILARRKGDVVPEQKLRGQRSQLHACQIAADAAHWAHRERREGIQMLDHLWLGIPSLRYKRRCIGVDLFIYKDDQWK